jgi:hypothetical protein
MYLYNSEHQLMDYHFNTPKVEEVAKEEEIKPDNGTSIDRTE